MNQATKDLIAAIATVAKDKQVFLTKTKLLKLLYLFDVEYFRRHRTTFTDFGWKFFHLGPWTNEFDPVLDELVRDDVLIIRPSSRPDYDSISYLPFDDQEIESVLTNVHDELSLKRILSVWLERPVGEILDHVYFHTEPMENAVRNTLLDFSVIPAQQPERYIRSSSQTVPEEASRLRRAFMERLQDLRTKQTQPTDFTPPRYDEEFLHAMAKLETDPA